ncbi:MAG: glycosyltransferase, partial [Chthoniobacterales bacterium]
MIFTCGSRANAVGGLAYLFERFPSYTQTFCFREVGAMRELVGEVPVFSIRAGEGAERLPTIEDVVYLPRDFSLELEDGRFRRAARRWLKDLVAIWGDETEKRRIYEALWLLPRLRERGVGHVHVHFVGIAARTAFWLRRIGGIQYSLTAHANDIFCDEPEERLGMLIAEAAGVVSVSDFSVAALRERYPVAAGKVRRVYNGVAMADYAELGVRADPPVVVTVGRCIAKKGFGDLVEACGLIAGVDFRCELIGDGPLMDGLRARVGELGIADRVDFAGAMGIGEIGERLARASVFALPCVDLPGGG